MKKPRIPILAILTVLFAVFLGGFFVGRNVNRTPVQISRLPAPTQALQTVAATSPEATESTESVPSGPININTADAETLDYLPGIGPVLAQRIVDYREQFGPFQSIGELINVSGIGTKKLEAIWDDITIGE